jgi:hypothetical protein
MAQKGGAEHRFPFRAADLRSDFAVAVNIFLYP